MAQYFTTSLYDSREALERQQRYVTIAAFGALALILINSAIGFSNAFDIIDLNDHSHHQRNPAVSEYTSTPVTVNSDGEYLYLSGAWF